jgi:hypothetical protein
MQLVYFILSEVENKTLVDTKIIFKDNKFQTKLLNLLNNPKNSVDEIIKKLVNYINNNYSGE